jgi:hypothetical protein
MRAVQIKGGQSASAKDLYIADNVDKPVPKEGEVLVKVQLRVVSLVIIVSKYLTTFAGESLWTE